MVIFEIKINIFKVFSKSLHSLDFSVFFQMMAGIKKWVKLAVWIFLKNHIFLIVDACSKWESTKKQKVSTIFSLNFSEILSDVRHAKGRESHFLFYRIMLIMPEEPRCRRFWVGYKIDMFLISCSNALFFRMVLMLKSRFHYSFLLILLLLYFIIIVTITTLFTGYEIS